jgi:hypothetical protein
VPQQFPMLEIAYEKAVAALRNGEQVNANKKNNPKTSHTIGY